MSTSEQQKARRVLAEGWVDLRHRIEELKNELRHDTAAKGAQAMSMGVDADILAKLTMGASCSFTTDFINLFEPAKRILFSEKDFMPSPSYDESLDDPNHTKISRALENALQVKADFREWLSIDSWVQSVQPGLQVLEPYIRRAKYIRLETEVDNILRTPSHPHITVFVRQPQQTFDPQEKALMPVELYILCLLSRKLEGYISKAVSEETEVPRRKGKEIEYKPPFYQYHAVKLVSISGSRARIVTAVQSFGHKVAFARGPVELQTEQERKWASNISMDICVGNYYHMAKNSDFLELMAEVLRRPLPVPTLEQKPQPPRQIPITHRQRPNNLEEVSGPHF
ncbi:uncharacterized protein KY384_004692 [Bacidia gigantensis]|uniref:uncharacterized protein n=1 Tax=Bacidia gigantensis TaxID=2732470 RepID=UPI001D0562EC|nr:uncharacterized protein KY384_004692 [Bacidia gigantensis]KAG8530192.1 hypothetical protein KY384_004692 [Bacidia gigantensis]